MGVSTEQRGSAYGQVSAPGVVVVFAASVVALGCSVAEAFLLLRVASPSSFLPEFAGWQVNAVEAAGAATLALLTVASVLAYRRRRGVSRRRLAVNLAVVPGLAIGGCLCAGLNASIIWSGSHTAQAAAARAAQAAYRVSPPPMVLSGPPADAALTARLLTASGLGAGWYPGIQPVTEGVKVTPEERSEGRVSQARTLLNQQHWTGTGWALDRVEIERITQFDSTAHAAAYLATWRQAHAGSTLTTFGTVTVAIARTQTEVVAAFVVGADAINLDAADTPTAEPQDQDAIITAAAAAASTAK